jgi:hypothetical protein
VARRSQALGEQERAGHGVEFAVLAGEGDSLFFGQRLSYLTHVGKEGVERADYGAIPRVLEEVSAFTFC